MENGEPQTSVYSNPTTSTDDKRRIETSISPQFYKNFCNDIIEVNHQNYLILPEDDQTLVNNKKNNINEKVNLDESEITKILEDLQKYLQEDITQYIQSFRDDWSKYKRKYIGKLSIVQLGDKIIEPSHNYCVDLIIKFIDNMSKAEVCYTLSPEELNLLLKTVASSVLHYLMYIETPIELVTKVMEMFPLNFTKIKKILSKYKKNTKKKLGYSPIFLYRLDSISQAKYLFDENCDDLSINFKTSNGSRISSECVIEPSMITSIDTQEQKKTSKKTSAADMIKSWRDKSRPTSVSSSGDKSRLKNCPSVSYINIKNKNKFLKSEFNSLTDAVNKTPVESNEHILANLNKFNVKKGPKGLKRITQEMNFPSEAGDENRNSNCILECVNSYQGLDLTSSNIVKGSFSSTYPELVASLSETEINQQEVILEFITTEKNYVQQLVILEKIFHLKLQQNNLLETNIRQALFYNLESLLEIHFEFVKTLINIKETIVPLEAFIKCINYMFLGPTIERLKRGYSNYCALQQDSASELKIRIEAKPDLALFFSHHQKLQFMKRLSFMDIRASVYQRIVKYPILFKSILHTVPPDSKHYNVLNNIMNNCKAIINFVNSANDEYNKYLQLINYKKKVNWKIYKNFKGDENTKKFVEYFEKLNLSMEMLIFETTATVGFGNKKFQDIILLVLTNFILFITKVSEKKYNLIPLVISKGQIVTPIIPLDGLVIRKVATNKNALYMMSASELEPLIINLELSNPNQMEQTFNSIVQHVESLSKGEVKRKINSDLLHKIITGQYYESSQTDTSFDSSPANHCTSVDEFISRNSMENSVPKPTNEINPEKQVLRRVNKSSSVYLRKSDGRPHVYQRSSRFTIGAAKSNNLDSPVIYSKGKSVEDTACHDVSNDSDIFLSQYSESNSFRADMDQPADSFDSNEVVTQSKRSTDKSTTNNFVESTPTHNSSQIQDDTNSECGSSDFSSSFTNPSSTTNRSQHPPDVPAKSSASEKLTRVSTGHQPRRKGHMGQSIVEIDLELNSTNGNDVPNQHDIKTTDSTDNKINEQNHTTTTTTTTNNNVIPTEGIDDDTKLQKTLTISFGTSRDTNINSQCSSEISSIFETSRSNSTTTLLHSIEFEDDENNQN